MLFVYGMLTGAGLLALAQNLFDYRIDTEVIEYAQSFVQKVKKFFGFVKSKI